MLMTVSERIRLELSGWQWWEIIYLLVCTGAIGVISAILGGDNLGIASAVAGTLYTLLAGKGKISCYFFGVFNSVTYGYIAYSQQLFGDAMLNWGWYAPMMIVGIFCWRKKRDEQNCIIKNRLSWQCRLDWLLWCIAGILFYAIVLFCLGGAQPLVDSTTTVLSVAAMILTVKRCVEQWLMWILVNLISVIMWIRVYQNGQEHIATLLWWVIMLITGVIFFIQWISEMKRAEKLN